ncbi:hypothetical protein PMAYCL1PPCAC_23740, partial [Pristionchus mayeri]
RISGEIRKDAQVSVAGLSTKEGLLITGGYLSAHSLFDSRGVVWENVDEPISEMCISRDERSLAASPSNIIKLLDISTGRETRRFVDHSSAVTSISSFSRSPYQWISGDDEGVCRISDARRHPSTLIALRQSRPVRCAYSSPDDSLIVIGDDACLQVYDMRQRKLLSRFIHSTIGVAFHPGERLMATFGDESIIRYWDLDLLDLVSQSEPYDERIVNAHFSFEGESLIVCSSEGVRSLSWEPCTLEWSHSFSTPSSLLSSLLDKDDQLRLVMSHPLTNTITLLSSPLKEMESRTNHSECDEWSNQISPVLQFLPSPQTSSSASNDVIFLPSRNEEERSLRVLSHPQAIQSNTSNSKSQVSTANKLTISQTSRVTLEDEKKKKNDERKGSLKRKEKKSSAEIVSLVDMDHSIVMDDLNGATSNLRALKESFRKGNLHQVMETWNRDRNGAVLSALCRQCTYRNLWNLSLSVLILPHLSSLLTSVHRELRGSAICALSSIVNAVGDLVNTMTRNFAPSPIGVDIAAEDRMNMCNSIEKELVLIQLREDEMGRVMSAEERTQLAAILALLPS